MQNITITNPLYPIYTEDDFFSENVHLNFNENLKNAVRNFMCVPTSKKIKDLKSILGILKKCINDDLKETRELFFARILSESKNLSVLVSQISEIISKGGENCLLKCASTSKREYYNIEILEEIITHLHQISLKIDTFSKFVDLPYYECGGKDCLFKLIKNPGNIADPYLEEVDEFNKASSLYIPEIVKHKDVFNATSFEPTFYLAIKYLSSLSRSKRLDLKTYITFFKQVKVTENLNDNVKAFILKLIVLTTSDEKKDIKHIYSIDNLCEFLHEVCLFNEKCSEEHFELFCTSPALRENPSLFLIKNVLSCFYKSIETYENYENLTNMMMSFSLGELPLEEFLEKLKINVKYDDLFPEDDLNKILNRFETDNQVKFPLSKKKIQKIGEDYKKIQNYCREWKDNGLSELANLIEDIRLKNDYSKDAVFKIIAIGRLAIYIKFGIYPNPVQILSLLGLLSSNTSCVAQVKTGEGKSIIVAILAFIMAVQNKSVHIISSSPSLSIRDQEEFFEFFKVFNLKTSHICEKPQASCFESDIIYGTAINFEFAVMREIFSFEKLFKQAKDLFSSVRFDCVIVDESDNLIIDTANNHARLSHPPEVTYEWVYPIIYNYVKNNLDNISVDALKLYMKEPRLGKSAEDVDCLSDEQIQVWLNSAFQALIKYKEKKDYIVGYELDYKGNPYKSILIIDAANSGKIQYGMRWGHGLHEFLEIKHNIPPKRESLIPIFISNSVFYQMYKSIFGLTGTLGAREEREELWNIYGIKTFDVPPYRPSLRFDMPPRLVLSSNYFSTILDKIKKYLKLNRPLLVLCANIQDTQDLHDILVKNNMKYELLNEIQQKSEKEIIKVAGLPGAVTIATNTAARGTNIKITKESILNGGLHVLITFYPESDRVEEQARGRAGRQGEPGSSEIIISCKELNIEENEEVINDAQFRENIFHKLRIKRAIAAKMNKKNHYYQAQFERECFKFVQLFYSQLKGFNGLLQKRDFLEFYGEALSNRRIIKELQLDFSLAKRDKLIASEALNLIKKEGEDSNHREKWKSLLIQMNKRIFDKVINDWSINYYKTIYELFEKSDLPDYFRKQLNVEWIKERSYGQGVSDKDVKIIFGIFEARIETKMTALYNDLVVRATALFQEFRLKWDKYLDESGKGIIEYLRETTKLPLKNLE